MRVSGEIYSFPFYIATVGIEEINIENCSFCSCCPILFASTSPPRFIELNTSLNARRYIRFALISLNKRNPEHVQETQFSSFSTTQPRRRNWDLNYFLHRGRNRETSARRFRLFRAVHRQEFLNVEVKEEGAVYEVRTSAFRAD